MNSSITSKDLIDSFHSLPLLFMFWGKWGWMHFTFIFTYPLTARRLGTTDEFTTSLLHFSLFSTALWDLTNSRPVHSLMLSLHLLFSLPRLFPPFTVPCKMASAIPDEREKCPYHFSLRLFMMVRRSSCGPIACWILAQTSSLVTWDAVYFAIAPTL